MEVDFGPIGDFSNMKALVAAARLLVQAKIAGGLAVVMRCSVGVTRGHR